MPVYKLKERRKGGKEGKTGKKKRGGGMKEYKEKERWQGKGARKQEGKGRKGGRKEEGEREGEEGVILTGSVYSD